MRAAIAIPYIAGIKIRTMRFRANEASINLINVLRAPASSDRVAGTGYTRRNSINVSGWSH